MTLFAFAFKLPVKVFLAKKKTFLEPYQLFISKQKLKL